MALSFQKSMKFNFKFLLAGVVLPVGFVSAFSANNLKEVQTDTALEVIRPYIVDIYDQYGHFESEIQGVSSKTDLFLISSEIGADPDREDRYQSFPEIKMGLGSKITLYRTPDLTILDGKKKIAVKSWASTVEELLSEEGVELADDDKVVPALTNQLQPKMEIKITRVAITQLKKTQTIDFKIVRKEDNKLDKGKTRIDQKGAKGEKILIYQIRREDGVEVSRKLIKTEVSKQPVDEILIIGTKPVITGWCRYNDWVLDASIKNGLDPDKLCQLMKKESNGNPKSVSGGGHLGLFQYTEGFWADASRKAGYPGASWDDPKSQIYTTAWALSHGYAGRWPGTWK